MDVKRRTEAKPLPTRTCPRRWSALPFGPVLLATSSSAAGSKGAAWAELLPVPARTPAAQPKPAQPAPCQPENFIPEETPYKRLDTGGTIPPPRSP
ncbi:hypothetical protein KYC5002_00280 [Archangium violaceum]|uniref:hypothetical protein n=1 Tax=Archangium violaceum TaxID=83451 RepID=UPI002B31E9BD|nr:hypothetical protein KYC5002_00280 [Archangium gephyra]